MKGKVVVGWQSLEDYSHIKISNLIFFHEHTGTTESDLDSMLEYFSCYNKMAERSLNYLKFC